MPNVWLGVSVEHQNVTWRIDWLCKTPATITFLSCEPLLGPLDVAPWLASPVAKLAGIDWAIAGGESGPRARPVDPAWIGNLRDQCQTAGVPFFFKQWGGRTPKAGGRVLDGRTWDEMPEEAW